MQVNSDGLIFVEFEYSNGAREAFNVSAITRIRQQSKEWCKKEEMQHPTVTLSIVGVEDDLNIGGLSKEDALKRINRAIEDHYNAIAEKFLLDKE